MRLSVCVVTAGAAIVSAGTLFQVARLSAQSEATTFKIAFYNIQSGKGAQPLPPNPPTFADTSNCTDASQPLNAWGHGVVQSELLAHVNNDPGIVALGIAEAWACAQPVNVRKALGWPAVAGERNGLSLVARYGFTGPEEWVQLDTSRNVTPNDTQWVVRRRVCLDAACSKSIAVHTTHWLAVAANSADSPAILDLQAHQTIDFMSQLPAGEPRILLGA